MASSYTGLGTELMTTGENAGTWGTTTNTNLQIIEQMVGGYTEQSIAGGVQTTTLSVSDGSTGAVLSHRVIKFTGTITGNQTVTIPLDVQQMYVLVNGTSGAYTVNFKYASGSGSSITFATTDKGTKLVYAAADHATNPNIVDSGIASTGAYDLEGNTLTLDADGDTDITADTDDQIDIKISGADDFTMTANAFNVLTGSHVTFADSANAKFGTGNDMLMYHDGSNSYITNSQGALKIATESSGIAVTIGHTTSEVTVADNLTVTGTLTLGSGAELTEAELEFLDGITAGTAAASKAMVLDSNADITGGRNLTISGELDAATLDISGNADIDGTLEADAYTIEGTSFIKVEGTNFTDSLLVGHSTTGTLDAATDNTGVGIGALDALTTGDDNTAIGQDSGSAVTTGGSNTFVGSNAGLVLAGGFYNTLIGTNAGDALVSGNENVAVGTSALGAGNGAYRNTIIGRGAGNIISSGDDNICIGHDAGNNITSGDGNVVIGQADVSSATGDDQLSISSGNDGAPVTWITGDSSGNITMPAEVAAATLDISGNIDIDGTSNLDAVDIDGAVQIDGAVTVGVDDTGLDVKFFGASAGAYMEWDESADQLRIMGASADATTSTGKLLLATSLTDINANDVIGKIEFQAPHEAGGTDAITVAASIQAIAQDTFSASVNATDLIFYTGHSEANTEKFRITSQGELGVGGANYGSDGQVLTSTGAGTAPAWEDSSGVAGKVEGTNFTDSLLVGHSTTGTLDAATENTGVGIDAMDAITTGDGNTALGYRALTAHTTGDFNVALGKDALLANTTGQRNVSVGKASMTTNVSGTDNTAVGNNALILSTGYYNTAVGKDSGYRVVGNYNTTLGIDAGQNITSGDGNVIIGTVDADSATGDRQLKIVGYDGSTTTTWIDGDSSGNLIFPADVTLGDDLVLDSDSAAIKFGDDQEITLTHTADDGLVLKHVGTGDGKEPSLTFQAGDNDIAADDVLGSIFFQAPDEGAGTDAILVAAGIEAVSEGDFSSSNNATKLSFKTAASEAATEKMSLSSGGNLTVSGDISANNFKFGGTNFTDSILIGHSTTGTLSTAVNNVGIGGDSGSYSLMAVTSGDNNFGALGALDALTTGSGNIAIGDTTMTYAVTGSNNIAFGSTAMKQTRSGDGNIGVGLNSLRDTNSTDYSVGVGNEAGKENEGTRNTYLGAFAGDNITSGAGNVIIGGVDADSATGSRQLKIGGYDGSTSTTWIDGDSNGVVKFSAANVTQQAITSSSNAVAWNAATQPNAYHITTENTTLSAPSNAVEGAFICIEINFNGSHTFSWNAIFNFAADTAPTTTDTDAKTDIFVFRYNGAIWQEVGRTLNIPES